MNLIVKRIMKYNYAGFSIKKIYYIIVRLFLTYFQTVIRKEFLLLVLVDTFPQLYKDTLFWTYFDLHL